MKTPKYSPITALLLAGAASLGLLAGCRGDRAEKPPRQFLPDMDDSPKFKPQTEAPFFADGRAMRPAVPGAVAFARVAFDPAAYQGETWAQPFLRQRALLSRDDKAYFEGTDDAGEYLVKIPISVPVNRDLIMRGQERFNIYCSACHGFTGNGKGMVGLRWSTFVVPSFHDPKYSDPAQRTGKDGYLFHTIRNGVPDPAGGFPKMPPYGQSVNEADAWAIVSYIRVLQQWQGGTIGDVPANEREGLVKAREAWLAANPPAPAPAAPQGEGSPK
jgi:mono/diheme cytochrome c family protein